MQKPLHRFSYLLSLVAIIYNSWPLGYLLDHHIARYGLASDLEDPTHPYAWVFITGDVITALILVGLSLYLHKNRPKHSLKYAWMSFCIGLLLFGFFTGFGAAAPDKCRGYVSVCTKVLGKNLSLDGLETSLASLGLFISLISSAVLTRSMNAVYKLMSWSVFLAWFISGAVLVHRVIVGQNVHSLQQLYLVLSGLGLICAGLNIDRLYKKT